MRSLLLFCAFAMAACGQQQSEQQPTTGPAIVESAPDGPSPAVIRERIAALPSPYSAGDYDNGRRVFAQCRSCHTLNAGGANRVGPNLHGVFGREAGTLEGFRTYSTGLKESGIVWDVTTMDTWIANPRDVVAANNMIFPGLRKPEDRRDVIAYIAVETAAD